MARDGRNLITWRGSPPLPINPVWHTKLTGFYMPNYPTLLLQTWHDLLPRLRSYCWENARRWIRPNFSVHPVGKKLCVGSKNDLNPFWGSLEDARNFDARNRCMQFRVIVVTDPPTHTPTNTPTHRQDQITIHCAAASAQCNNKSVDQWCAPLKSMNTWRRH